ncbi:DUF4625 domain-containing protein [Tenacibaculum dicentrarchi]|nr:DUF4625 domain-containing protein [Tenacibaculum dicentrarchi]MCD8406600.1 DUF4625 domain-containing protein [Tenacibaculum dicentrarchi]MCD8423949.1 DUF4625 domain-containing protein [Tenacibaculum dicentrarchi]MCD8441254.1 DUF4625 domain-containing protein [Tenacibaculum dicentrarchi]MCD8448339.1 DUF4625 domain-containing protein [Tenacibaculum dicentrarchi]
MNYKKFLNIFILATVFAITMISCTKEEIIVAPALGIINLEFGAGHSSDKTIKQGGNIHIGAGIFADEKIKNILVEIYLKDSVKGDWKLKELFTEGYQGAKEVNFHKHVDISYDAKATDYIFSITVEDEKGKKKTREDVLKVMPYDILLKDITYGTASNNDKIAIIGEDLNIQGLIKSRESIKNVVVSVSEFIEGEGWKYHIEKEFNYSDKNIKEINLNEKLMITNALKSNKTYDLDIIVQDKNKERVIKSYALTVK